MKAWLTDAIDQVALGEHLAGTSISCGTRFGLIAVDNAVEYMLVAYIKLDRQLVGGHKSGGITKKDWEKAKQNFEDLIDKVCGVEPNLRKYQKEINRYHQLRNDLYHGGIPTTVAQNRVTKYSALARSVLETLYGITFDSREWDDQVASVGQALVSEEAPTPIRRTVSFELEGDIVRVRTSAQPKASDWIALALHGYLTMCGKPPEKDSLEKTIKLSGYPITRKTLNTRISELRGANSVRKDRLQLTAKATSAITKEYSIQ